MGSVQIDFTQDHRIEIVGASLHYPFPQTSLDAMVQLETRLNIQGEIVFQCFFVPDLLSELLEILR